MNYISILNSSVNWYNRVTSSPSWLKVCASIRVNLNNKLLIKQYDLYWGDIMNYVEILNTPSKWCLMKVCKKCPLNNRTTSSPWFKICVTVYFDFSNKLSIKRYTLYWGDVMNYVFIFKNYYSLIPYPILLDIYGVIRCMLEEYEYELYWNY